jgi:hypothetical protein
MDTDRLRELLFNATQFIDEADEAQAIWRRHLHGYPIAGEPRCHAPYLVVEQERLEHARAALAHAQAAIDVRLTDLADEIGVKCRAPIKRGRSKKARNK